MFEESFPWHESDWNICLKSFQVYASDLIWYDINTDKETLNRNNPQPPTYDTKSSFI